MMASEEFDLFVPEVQALMARDRTLALLIEQVGSCSVRFETNHFEALIRIIVGQQLSTRAANAIYQRICCRFKDINPEAILSLTTDEFKQAGLSSPKIHYVRKLSEAIIAGTVALDGMDSQSDNQIIQELIKIKGVGTWTAEMFLVFALRRPDVLSFQDRGLQKGIGWLFGVNSCSPTLLQQCQKLWTPYNSVASFFLWAAVDNGIIH